MDAEVMDTMLNMEGDVLTITIEEPCDPSTFIMLANGLLGLGFLRIWERNFVIQVQMYFSTFSIR